MSPTEYLPEVVCVACDEVVAPSSPVPTPTGSLVVRYACTHCGYIDVRLLDQSELPPLAVFAAGGRQATL